MDILLKEQFLTLWKKYFGNAELPIVFYYTDGDGGSELVPIKSGRSCIICELAAVRSGRSLVFNAERIKCGGGRRYLGYTERMRPGFEYFLSCGNDSIEGERYLRTPEQVNEFMKNQKDLHAEGRNIVFKRWDKLTESDQPEVVIFFAAPDVLSGLFTLANFDQTEPNGTFTPFGAGCGSIVYYPYMESKTERQRAVIGLFDPSARPCVPKDVLTFAVPVKRFERMISLMEESFLITGTWKTVRKRIG
ncbi:MAG TPA: DUF169 domain-containing protein [Bacteroidales bacterium]|jgi:uncharacterized protein (DUF169 family)|nr:DUF169 domain-containing protein [Bacteroidales bacterium]